MYFLSLGVKGLKPANQTMTSNDPTCLYTHRWNLQGWSGHHKRNQCSQRNLGHSLLCHRRQPVDKSSTKQLTNKMFKLQVWWLLQEEQDRVLVCMWYWSWYHNGHISCDVNWLVDVTSAYSVETVAMCPSDFTISAATTCSCPRTTLNPPPPPPLSPLHFQSPCGFFATIKQVSEILQCCSQTMSANSFHNTCMPSVIVFLM